MHPCKNMKHLAGKTCPLVISGGGTFVDAVWELRNLREVDPVAEEFEGVTPLFRNPRYQPTRPANQYQTIPNRYQPTHAIPTIRPLRTVIYHQPPYGTLPPQSETGRLRDGHPEG